MFGFQRVRFALRMLAVGQTSRLSRRAIHERQQTRLRRLVDFARRHSPFYHRRFAGLPANVPLDQLPVVTKEEIRQNFDDVVTDRQLRHADLEQFTSDTANLGRWYRGRYAVCHTSGTTGAPLMIVQDRACMELILSTMTSRGRPGDRPGFREGLRRFLQPTRVASLAFHRGFHPSGIVLEFTQETLSPFIQLSRFSSIQPDLIERLNALQPNVISAYPSILLALVTRPTGLDLRHLEYITTSAEKLDAGTRRKIETAFGVPVIDHYGVGECLQLADECRHCHDLHVNADWAILETVDDNYRPVPPGEVGSRVLVTNLANRIQPFIRYEVSDRVALRAPGSDCPNALPRIERIEGRAAELFLIRDRSGDRLLSGTIFQMTTDAVHVVRNWRAILRARNRIELQVELLPGAAEHCENIHHKLESEIRYHGLCPTVRFDVVVVDALDPDPRTGKMRRMINEVPQPASPSPIRIAA